eukprot:441023-Pelagomonas_calceolata.AAC.1
MLREVIVFHHMWVTNHKRNLTLDRRKAQKHTQRHSHTGSRSTPTLDHKALPHTLHSHTVPAQSTKLPHTKSQGTHTLCQHEAQSSHTARSTHTLATGKDASPGRRWLMAPRTAKCGTGWPGNSCVDA